MNINTSIFKIQPTATQAATLKMADYILPICKRNHKFTSDLNIFMFDGTRGSGKSDLSIWEIKMQLDKGYGSEYKCMVFRKNMGDLKDYMNKCNDFFKLCGYKFTMNRGMASPSIKFSTGEIVFFQMMRNLADYAKIHGFSIQHVIMEEATLWSEITELMTSILSCMRSPWNKKYENEIAAGEKPPMILRFRLTTNPHGAGKYLLKKLFVDNQKVGVPFLKNGITYCRFVSTFLDNPYIEDTYINQFLLSHNKSKVAAFCYADWETENDSACFGSLYDPSVFNIPTFKIPTSWSVFRCYDHGTKDPFSVLWFAETNDEEFTFEFLGKKRTIKFPKDSIILINEYYGCDPKIGQNHGLRMNATNIAKNIKRIEDDMYKNLLERGHYIEDGPADNNIRNDTGTIKTVEELFEDQGITWEKSTKTKGSRIAGVDLMIEIMTNTLEKSTERKHFYIFADNCPNFIEDVFSLEYDDKVNGDVKTSGVADHSWDCCRYFLLRLGMPETSVDYG